jgi:hypothetical protein
MTLNQPKQNKSESKPKSTLQETQANRMSLRQKAGLALGTLAIGLGAQSLPSMGMEKAQAANLDTQVTTEHVNTSQNESVTQAQSAPIEIAQANQERKRSYNFKNDAERDTAFKKVLDEGIAIYEKNLSDLKKINNPQAKKILSMIKKNDSAGFSARYQFLQMYNEYVNYNKYTKLELIDIMENHKTSLINAYLKKVNDPDTIKSWNAKGNVNLGKTVLKMLKINYDSNLND